MSQVPRPSEKQISKSVSKDVNLISHSIFYDALSLNLLDGQLKQDLRSSLTEAIEAGAKFPCKPTPLTIFRHSISGVIENHKNRLKNLITGDDKSSHDDYCKSVRFTIHCAVSAIQGELAELLALGPIVKLVSELKSAGEIPESTLIFAGDTIAAPRLRGSAMAKAADVHFLIPSMEDKSVTLIGVAEVKSYKLSKRRITSQLNKHISRASRGIAIHHPDIKSSKFSVNVVNHPLKIFVIPSSWRLARHIRFESGADLRKLIVTPPMPIPNVVSDEELHGKWRIELRWSNEALASAAFNIVNWCLGRVGEEVYSRVPPEWSEMSPFQAGQNAVKEQLYHALLDIKDAVSYYGAVKLYNILGFGFALGANFKGQDNKPDMLWPEDLDEIFINGKTKHGCSIKGIIPFTYPSGT